jgi:hypothetical protein
MIGGLVGIGRILRTLYIDCHTVFGKVPPHTSNLLIITHSRVLTTSPHNIISVE